MTWHQEPKKDVTSCEKLRLGANIHRPADVRMGKPGGAILRQPALNQIGVGGEPPELKHLSRARKRKQHVIPRVAASEMGRGQTGVRACRGSDRGIDSASLMERFWESLPERVKAPYMKSELTRRDPEYHETRGTLWE